MKIIKPFYGGKHCFVVEHQGRYYKIFNSVDVTNFDGDIRWGDLPKADNPNMSVLLREATVIQNICAFHDLAPRVYGIVGVRLGGKKHLAQNVELVDGGSDIDQAMEVYGKIKQLGKEYGFTNEKDDVSVDDVRAGKLLDFNTFHFTPDHEEVIKKKYIELAKYGKIYYHNVPEWGLTNAPRQNNDRIKMLGLDKIDFSKKSFIDFGCAGGYFVRYAKDKGAKTSIGIDSKGKGSPDPVMAARLLSNELEYWGLDYENLDLGNTAPIVEADIVLFASMNFHIGIPEWLPRVTKELCVFEDNSKKRDALPELKKIFKKVERVGTATDHGHKPCYHCWV